MSQHLDTLKICERNNGRRIKKVSFGHRNNNTAAEKQGWVVDLEKVVFRERNCERKGKLSKEIENFEPTQLDTLLERFYAEIKNTV